jgi:glucose/arabinose dehydrogenase
MKAACRWRKSPTLIACVLSLLTLLSQVGVAAPRPQSLAIALEPVADALQQPVAIAHAGDGSGRLFIVEQGGVIKICDGSHVLPAPFLDITAIVKSSGNEQGLLGLAFHPNYAANGYFYVNYTGKSGVAGDTVVARYRRSTDNPNLADPAATVLLTIAQPEANHNGGQLQFGPDGYLYIGTGDGGGAGDQHGTIGNAQSLNTLLGKILRIDVNNTNTGDGLPYDIPPDNPFANDNNPSTRAEIWAYGLRNPWRFTFDRQTHDLFIGDVGQGSREEVDFQPAGSNGGENYGWRCREGDQPFNMLTSNCSGATFTSPILVYNTPSNPCGAITGGYRYRGSTFPQINGVYFYADYCTGRIWGAVQNGTGWATTQLLDTDASISTFGEDQNGELYVADRAGGQIYRIVGTDQFFGYLPIVRR